MTTAIRDSLPFAVAIVISGAPILALVLLMVTARPMRIPLMFLLGWATGIAAVAGAIVGFVDATASPRGGPSTIGAMVRILLGAAVGVLAARSWGRRFSSGAPQWMNGVMAWSASRALMIGLALGSINPKNLALVAAGSAAILTATSVPLEQALTILVLAAVASLGVATPVLLRAFGGRTVVRALERAAEWMTTNGKTISAVVLAAIACVLVMTGLRGLSAA